MPRRRARLTGLGCLGLVDRLRNFVRMPRRRGSQARANLLVVPCRTTTALAVMVLRQAAGLPILSSHLDTPAYRAANDIVSAAQAVCEGGKAHEQLNLTQGADSLIDGRKR